MSVQKINSSSTVLPYPLLPPLAAPIAEIASDAASYRTSVRRMNQQLAVVSPAIKTIVNTATQRFIKAHPYDRILAALNKFRASEEDLALFKKIIEQEDESMLGYQAGSSTVRLFQDVLSAIVEKILKIPVKEDFVFLRVPGDSTFRYEHALDFIKDYGAGIRDDQAHIRQHILSMNMNLYQSYDADYDLTPRYYLENTTYTHANVREILKPFFASLGIEGSAVDQLWNQALSLLSHDRGYILQIFDQSRGFSFARQHTYLAHSGGRPNPQYRYHEILFDSTSTNFPQMRLVMSNRSTLNPYSSLSIKRYDNMTDEQREKYESDLGALVENLPFDANKVKEIRGKLLDLWTKG